MYKQGVLSKVYILHNVLTMYMKLTVLTSKIVEKNSWSSSIEDYKMYRNCVMLKMAIAVSYFFD